MPASTIVRKTAGGTACLVAVAALALAPDVAAPASGGQSPAPQRPAAAPSALPQLPQCLQADAQLETKLDTAVNGAGDAFSFTILDRVPPVGTLPEIPAGAKGYGIVLYVQHARSSGVPGLMVLEPRFIRVEGDLHVPVMPDPALQNGVLMQGASGNAPGALEYVPFVGLAFSGYNVLHHGKEIVVPRGARFKVIVGDDLATSTCYVAPSATPQK
jgi:hypothetical protein